LLSGPDNTTVRAAELKQTRRKYIESGEEEEWAKKDGE
jgi:hypothetical protein